jgi:hypothetical protein
VAVVVVTVLTTLGTRITAVFTNVASALGKSDEVSDRRNRWRRAEEFSEARWPRHAAARADPTRLIASRRRRRSM